MLAHTIFGTNKLEQAAAFYDQVLGLLDAKRELDLGRGYAWGTGSGEPMFCIMKPFNEYDASVGNGSMVAFSANSKATVDATHAKAIELGGSDEGAPGERGDGFYAAYFRDLDGNKVCVCYISLD